MEQANSEYVDISTIGLSSANSSPAHLPTENATTSYWIAAATNIPESSIRLLPHSDVVIIGSGITGISCAYHLAQSLPHNSSITVIEARSFCSGATGRNGGHLTPVSALAYSDLAANPNHLLQHDDQSTASVKDAVRKILAFEAHVASALTKLITVKGAPSDVGFTERKNWHLCFKQEEVAAFDSSLNSARDAGLLAFVDKVRRVPLAEVQETLVDPVGIVAVYEIPGATLHPRQLVAHLFRLAQKAASERNTSLNLLTETPVTNVTPLSHSTTTGYSSRLTTRNGHAIKARYVVHATNGYVSHLLPSLAGPAGIVPTRAQVVAFEPVIAGKRYWHMGISSGGGYEYGHQRPASTLEPNAPFIFGGGREYAPQREWGIDDDSTLCPEVSAFLHPWLSSVFPRQYGSKPSREWTGIMGYTNSKDPLIGPLPEQGQYIAAGYSGHGMTRAFGCAEIIAQMISCKERNQRWECPESFPRCYLTSSALLL